MSTSVSYFISTTGNITVFINGEPHCFYLDKNKDICEKLKSLIVKQDFDNIVEIVKNYEQDNGVREYIEPLKTLPGIEFTDDTVTIDGELIDDALSEQILLYKRNNLNIMPFVNFIRNLKANPSYRVRHQLYRFIKKSMDDGGFHLTQEGNIVAYKRVKNNLKDIYTGTIDNSPGKIISMDRTNVNDDPNQTCSAGLHFCSYSYLEKYAHSENDKILVVEINPADVVSIPTDHNDAKGRCCKYKVISILDDNEKKKLESPIYHKDDVDDDDDASIDNTLSIQMVMYNDEDLNKFLENKTKKELTDIYNELIKKYNIDSKVYKKFKSREIGKNKIIVLVTNLR